MFEDKQNLLYLSFMIAQLSALNRINKIFQSANPDPCAIHKDLQDYVSSLLDQAVMPAALHGIRENLENLSETICSTSSHSGESHIFRPRVQHHRNGNPARGCHCSAGEMP